MEVSKHSVRYSSSTPQDAMVASQQVHINDLVQKNRALEHTVQQLHAEFASENLRNKEAVKTLQQRFKSERVEWQDGCDILQACHRMTCLRKIQELDMERLQLLKERELLRKERLACRQRDFQITMFQVREMELDDRIQELEDMVEESKVEIEDNAQSFAQKYQQTVDKLKARLAEFSEEVRQKEEELANAQTEKNSIESKHATLRKEHADLSASAASAASKLERTTLQLDGAQTSIAELERLYDELKRQNAELKRQTDKWQMLGNKEGAEVEFERRKRIQLEVQVKELENHIEEMGKKEGDHSKAAEKERKKMEKLKKAFEQTQQELQEAQETTTRYETELDEARTLAAKTQSQLEKLKAQLDTERAKNRASSRMPVTSEEINKDQPDSSEDEVEMEIAQTASPHPEEDPKPRSRPSKTAPISKDHDARSTRSGPKKVAAARGEKKAAPNSMGKGKRMAPSTEGLDGEGEDSDVAENSTQRSKITTKETDRKPKEGTRRGTAASKTGSAVKRDGNRNKPKSTARAESARPRARNGDESAEENMVPKKKKRKINIFPASQPTSFPWASLPQGDGALDIPTELSPVKDTDPTQQRSMLGVVSSAFGFGKR